MSRFDKTVTDLDHLLQPHVFLDADPDARRRNLDAALMYVYRLRDHRMNELGKNEYWARARATPEGQTTEALVMVRNSFEHDLSVIIAPRETSLYPPFFPGRWTFPGSNPTWLRMEETGGVFDKRPKELREAYRDTLEGMIAGYAFDAARNFLVVNVMSA
ncbi:hypothetical protein [Arthrobacter pigmenti]